MTLPEILDLLKIEKNARDTESRRLFFEARQGAKHDAKTVKHINRLQNEEMILSGAIRAITESGFRIA